MLSLRIALRYLFSRKSHGAVNTISLISMAGVAVAAMATVCVLSVFNGFSDLAHSRLSTIDPRVKVERLDGRTIASADALAARLGELPEVAVAVPTLQGQALAVLADKQMPVTLKGVGAGYDRVAALRQMVIDGEYIDPAEADSLEEQFPMIAGRSCAALSVGVAVNVASRAGVSGLLGVYVPRRTARINPANPVGAFAADSVIVTAVFEVDQPEYDADMVVVPIETVRALMEYDNAEATAIEIAPAPGVDDAAALRAVRELAGSEYVVKDRLAQQERSMRMIAVEKWISLLLLAFILIIASFNIISTLSILIIEKEENIATMSALGASKRLLTRIFMTQGWLVSTCGGVVGIVLGVVLCLAQEHWGVIKLAGEASQLSITAYPVALRWSDILIVAALVALVGMLSTAVTRRFIGVRCEV